MENDQIWETIIQQTENELLSEETHNSESLNTISHIGSVMPQFMSAHDITVFISILAESHACDSQSISYYYEPIINEEGCLSIDELILVFSIKSLIDGDIVNRIIHRMRTIVPQEVQQRARAMLRKEQNEANILTSSIGEMSIPDAQDKPVSLPPCAKKNSPKRIPKARERSRARVAQSKLATN